VHVEGYGPVLVDVGYGGNMYAIVESGQFGLDLGPTTTQHTVQVAAKIRAAVNEQLTVVHPELPDIRGVTHVQFFTDTAADGRSARVMVIVPPGLVDRSPCGTGTTAKVATLLAKGELELGEEFTHHSVTGAAFVARAVETARVGGDRVGCRVDITGRSYLIADTTIYVNTDDPLARGFQLS
jgi:proline racemase